MMQTPSEMPEKYWVVEYVIDYWPGNHYRYIVEGINYSRCPIEPPSKFRWHLHLVDSPVYDLSNAIYESKEGYLTRLNNKKS